MTEDEVDKWIKDNNQNDGYELFDELLPKHRVKLIRLDKRIIAVLSEIKEVFPDAQYYTGSGGFSLVLGDTHDETSNPQHQRTAWSGYASISDGDW